MKKAKQQKLEPDVRTVGRYSFVWTEEHIPKEDSDPLRFEYDELSSAVVDRIQELHRKQSNTQSTARLDLYSMLEQEHETDEILGKFWDEVHTVPEWVDWEQLARGQRFFYRYAVANLIGFAFQGFVGENSTSSSVVEVLVRTGGFSTRVLLRRLLETFQFVLEVTHSIGFIKPGGDGHKTAVRVRLLHAMVRQRIMKMAEIRGPSYYDISVHGVPTNKLDHLHALTTFCNLHAYRQLPIMGITVPESETADYVALWRYLGYILGTPTEHFVSSHKAKILMESMSYNELSVSPNSLVVGHNFVEAVKDVAPVNLSGGFIEAGSRVLNGDEFCDNLSIGKPGLYSYACFRGHCWFVRTMAVLQRLFPSLDEKMIDFNREVLHAAIIRSKSGLDGGSKMEFKHVPNGSLTGKESGWQGKRKIWFYERPLELFYFAVFALGCGMMAGLLFSLLKLAKMLR